MGTPATTSDGWTAKARWSAQTAWVSVPWLPRKTPVGEYTAFSAWLPADRPGTTRTDVARPPLPRSGLPGPRSVAPSKNSTAPVGVPDTALITVAVRVMACPARDGFGVEVRAVVVTPVGGLKSRR